MTNLSKLSYSSIVSMVERLPQNYIPIYYDLFIHYTPKKHPFTASVTIVFDKNQDDDKVILNVEKNITIQQVTQNSIQLKYTVNYPQIIIYRSKDPDQDICAYPIKIEYLLTPLSNDFEGFYEYEGSYLTQFETHYTRKMLPCFDEPCIRSSFTVRIRIPSDYNGISNMPTETTETENDEKYITFKATPKMCCYLLCICVGKFEPIRDVTKRGIPVIFYGDPEIYDFLLEYIKFGSFALDWMEEKTGVEYELPHLQFIMHKGIKLGMENYGLIALSEEYIENKLINVLTILHEVSHLWFGDLVSTKWWDSVWLNEGFAQYFEYLMLKDSMLQGSGWAIQLFIKYDGLRCLTYFDRKKVVPDESEINYSHNLLGSIIYIKGAFILKMFSDMVGEKNFFHICSNWLNKFKNKPAIVSDFIETVNETLNADYSDFFNTWLRKVGMPCLNVCEKYSPTGEIKGVTITQSSVSDSLYTFMLPICYGVSGVMKRVEIMIKDKETVFDCDCDFDWMIVDDNVDSLCAVIYSNVMLQKLNEARLNGLLSENDELLVYLSPLAVESHMKIEAELKNLCNQFASNNIPYRESFFNNNALIANDSYSYVDDDNDNKHFSSSIDDSILPSHSYENDNDN